MRFLRTNTAIRLTVGPFLDKTDGVTPETTLTVTSCKLTLMVDDGNVPTLVLDTNPTASGGANDMVHVTGDDAGFYDLELAAGNVNYLGRAMLAITDAATHCPVFHEFMILPANVYDSLVLGTDTLNADVTQIGGDTQSATDLKDFADAGYDPSTNKVQGVVLVDTLTTYTSNTPQTGDAYAIVNSGTHGNSALKTLIDTVDTVVDSILVDTAEIGVAGAGLTNINLPNQTMDIVGNITGNLSGSVGSVTGAVGSVTGAVGSVTGAVGSVTGNVGGNVTGSVGSVAAGGITAASIATGAIDADALAADAGTELADAILSRNVSNVEGSAGEHTLCTVVLAMLENSISGTTLTIKRTDGSTTHFTKTLTADAAADPIVGIQ